MNNNNNVLNLKIIGVGAIIIATLFILCGVAAAPLLADTISDSSGGDFNGGTYNGTEYISGALRMNPSSANAGFGEYISSVKKSPGNSQWNNIAIVPIFPFGKNLPNNKSSEVIYDAGNVNMAGNVLLLHLDDNLPKQSFFDSSGSSNTATCSGSSCPSTQTDRVVSRALNFDGIDDYLSCGVSGFPSSAPITLEVRASFDSTPSDMIVLQASNHDSSDGFIIGFEGQSGRLFYIEDGDKNYAGNINDTQEHHIVFVFNSSVPYFRSYIDGGEVAGIIQPISPLAPSGKTCTVGASRTTDGSVSKHFNGAVREVAVYDRALNAQEIMDRYMRGIANISLQVRSCDDENCSGESFTGPDGTSNTFFRIDPNTSSSPMPSFGLSSLGNNRYFQYILKFFTDNPSHTPDISSVSIDYTSLNVAPSTPSITSPSAGATEINTNTQITASGFSDSDGDTHTKTIWEIDDNYDFKSPEWVRIVSPGEESTHVNSGGVFYGTLSGNTSLAHNKTYYVRVRYEDSASSSSDFSPAISFTTDNFDAPTITQPANNATVHTLSPTILVSGFNDSSGHSHSRTQWQVSESQTFSNPIYDAESSASLSHTIPAGYLSDGKFYHIRVRFKDSAGHYTDWSPIASFRAIEASVSVTPLTSGATSQPNQPVNISAQITDKHGLAINNASVKISIYSPSGSKLIDGATMSHRSSSSGIYDYTYTPTATGIYTYEITATSNGVEGFGGGNMEIKTLDSDVVSTKTTVEQINQTLSDHEASQSSFRDATSDSLTTIEARTSSIESKIDSLIAKIDSLITSRQKSYDVVLEGADKLNSGDTYRAILTVTNFESNPANLSSLPTVQLYNPLRSVALTGNMSEIGVGTYEFTYDTSTLNPVIAGLWEARVSVALNSSPVVLSDYFTLSGSPPQVMIVGVSDNTLPDLSFDVSITNEGTADFEYTYVWCLVDTQENQCGGGDDVDGGSASKLISSGDTFQTSITANANSPGEYWFKVLVDYGDDSSAAWVQFSAVNNSTGSSGGGGGSRSGSDGDSPGSGFGNDILFGRLDLEDSGDLFDMDVEISDAVISLQDIYTSLGMLSDDIRKVLNHEIAARKDLEYIMSTLKELRALSELSNELSQNQMSPLVKSWMVFEDSSRDTILLNYIISNPGDKESKFIFKSYLPKNIAPEDILGAIPFSVEYDEGAERFYITESLILSRKDTIKKIVRIKNIWKLDSKQIGDWDSEVENIVSASGRNGRTISERWSALRSEMLATIGAGLPSDVDEYIEIYTKYASEVARLTGKIVNDGADTEFYKIRTEKNNLWRIGAIFAILLLLAGFGFRVSGKTRNSGR